MIGVRLTQGRLAVLAATLTLLATPTLAASSTASSQLPPLSAARVRTLAPRVLNLQPRIIDLAPKQTNRGRATVFTVDTDVLFAFGSASLSPAAQTVLARVVHDLGGGTRPGTVTIVGYTDSVGTTGYNLGLSQRRALAVQAYLATHVGNSRLHYRSQGKGKSDPVASNTKPNGSDNPDGRRQNRRVMITRGP